MAGHLVGEVRKYLAAAGKDLTPNERVVLLLIAERANTQSREAWSGGTERWNLLQLTGLTATGLRGVLQRLSARGVEVRTEHGKDSQGRPVYASWNRQTTYRLPILLGDVPASPTGILLGDVPAALGDVPASPTGILLGDVPAALGDVPAALGDVPAALGDVPASPFSSSTSGPSGPVTDYGRASPRSAAPHDEPPEEQPRDTLTADEAKAQARAIAAQSQKRPPKIHHWVEGTAPQGEPNPLYDPAVAARAALEEDALDAAREDAVLGEKPEDTK